MRALFFNLSILLLFSSLGLSAQTLRPLKKEQELVMPKTAKDEYCGKRGASVVWHPKQKKYYAVFAGNARFPSAVFDGQGNRLSDENQLAMVDARGLWYNPSTKKIVGNGYEKTGWYEYNLDKNGLLTDVEITYEGMQQPNEQCVGIYNPKSKQVLFLDGSRVFMYSDKAVKEGSLTIHFGRKKSDGAASYQDLSITPEEYNSTSLIYTGIKGQELGFENIEKKQIELYDIKTGFITKILMLPEMPETEGLFNFSYANDIYWLFDLDKRTWIGYK